MGARLSGQVGAVSDGRSTRVSARCCTAPDRGPWHLMLLDDGDEVERLLGEAR